MCDKNRPCSNDAVEKMIGNMTAEMQNKDGQYVPLGFTPPPEQLNWPQATTSYISPYNLPYVEPHVNHHQFEQAPRSYMPPANQLYEPPVYKRAMEYEIYKAVPNGVPESHFNTEFNYLSQGLISNNVLNEHSPQTSHHTQLIENLVGNWVVPNTSGTYSPFGNPESFKPNVFDLQNHSEVPNKLMNQTSEELKIKEQTIDDKQFQFNRDLKKPRMVAEVKPMRPSYSDVLTKPVPPTATVNPKTQKTETKEQKSKKDTRKNSKNEKNSKAGSILNRSNTNNDIKDIPTEKTANLTKNDKKNNRNNQLNRKWASLDNITENHSKSDSDVKTKKKQDENVQKPTPKNIKTKINKTMNDISDLELDNGRTETFNITKNSIKKSTKNNMRQKQSDSFNSNDRLAAKRNQRPVRKKEKNVPFGVIGQKVIPYVKGWWKIFTVFILWLFNLISDVCSLSIHISRDFAIHFWSWLCVNCIVALDTTVMLLKKVKLFTWIWEKFKGKKKKQPEEEKHNFAHCGLENNINMPTTGDEAMKRLLACKGKDPYSILGVSPTCTDDDIKRYYKRQAFLVHPDKNNQPGAEEAFKILIHAFDMIGTSERRASYDRGVVESAQVVQAWSELTELLQQLQQKVEAAATTIRCSACGARHRRAKVERPSYAARNCKGCKIHHSAREGDIWAEARCFGLLWHYYACMEGAVYDITEWAGCQKESLKHLRPDSHHVQYRIALGKQNGQPRRNSSSPRTDRPDLENLLNSLYGQNEGGAGRRKNKNKK